MRSRLTFAGLALACALLSSTPVWADRDGWVSYREEGGCIGGAKCGENGWQLRIRLEDAPVAEVRFHAHDDVGEKSSGHLRVRIDGNVLEDDIDVPKNGDWYHLPADRLRGRDLLFEAFAHDEVVVEDIEVRYQGGRGGRDGDRGGRGGHGRRGDGDWESYSDGETCIGGSRCGDKALRIRLDDRPVLAVRFRAHDNVGDRSRGHLRVRIDDDVLARDIDVPKDGDDFELDAGRSRGRSLVFESLADDEVVIEDVEVQYGRRR